MNQKALMATLLILFSGMVLAGCAKHESTPTMGRSEVREVMSSSLQDLKEGHPASYYVGEFERLGYKISAADYQPEQTRYELKKGTTIDEVTLIHPMGRSTVSQIQVKQLGWFSANATNKDMATQTLRQELTLLKTGKKPEEYIPLLEKYGTVSEYKLNRENAKIRLSDHNRHYKIQLNINPETQKVTSIELEKGFLQFPG